MKKHILIICSLFIISCSDNIPSCEDNEVIETVIELLKDDYLNNKGLKHYGTTSESLKLELDLIKTNGIDKELKKCNCEASLLNAPLSFNKAPTIYYEAQMNNKGEVIVTAYPEE